MSWGLRGAPRGYLGSPGGPFLGLGGLRGEPGRVIGAPWEVPGELRGVPGAPRWGPWGGLGRFWGPLGRTVAEKVATAKVRQPFIIKKGAEWEPRAPILGYKINRKSHQNLNAILATLFKVPGHPLGRKSSIFNGGLFEFEARPFCAHAPPRSICGGILAPERDPNL